MDVRDIYNLHEAYLEVYQPEISKFCREDYDLYDIILSHLLDEGYADSLDSAENIYENMSEEWLYSILEANRGDQYATRNMDSREAEATKDVRRNYRNTSGGHLYASAATDERTNRHRGAGHAVPGYQGRGQTSRPDDSSGETFAQSMLRTSPGQDRTNRKAYVRKELKARRSARKYIRDARR